MDAGLAMMRLVAVQTWPVWPNAPTDAMRDGAIEVGVVEDDERVLAAHLQLDAEHRGRTARRLRGRRPRSR